MAGILLESTRNEKQNRQQYCKLVRGSAVLLVNRLLIFIADQTERVRQAKLLADLSQIQTGTLSES